MVIQLIYQLLKTRICVINGSYCMRVTGSDSLPPDDLLRKSASLTRSVGRFYVSIAPTSSSFYLTALPLQQVTSIFYWNSSLVAQGQGLFNL